jgi:hypothetical protein
MATIIGHSILFGRHMNQNKVVYAMNYSKYELMQQIVSLCSEWFDMVFEFAYLCKRPFHFEFHPQ